jgi:NAD-dependent deacetylase
MEQNLIKAANMLLGSEQNIAITGAGISVPSGIPDFRSKGGLWSRFDIREYGTIQAFKKDPYKTWELFRELATVINQARPNTGHQALAELEKKHLLAAVVTQNIDNLHQRAGSQNVIEFHGSGESFSCLWCNTGFSVAHAHTMLDSNGIPHCTCGSPLKPDIILFGESVPEDAVQQSFTLARTAAIVLVVGTSATVAPASFLPQTVRSHGGKIIEMNITPTDLTPHTDLVVTGDVSQTLPALLQVINHLTGNNG